MPTTETSDVISRVDRPAITIADAADLLGVTRQTIHKLINRGDLTRFKVAGCTRLNTAEVLAMVGVER